MINPIELIVEKSFIKIKLKMQSVLDLSNDRQEAANGVAKHKSEFQTELYKSLLTFKILFIYFYVMF